MPNESQDRDSAAYHASAWMALLIEDAHQADKLDDQLRQSFATSLELFRTQGAGAGNPDLWHTDLYDWYTETPRARP